MKVTRTLLASCNKGDMISVLYHLAKGADVNGIDSRGWFPLGGAVYGEHQEIVELLIEFGANINQRSEYNWTPLYIAAWRGNEKIVKVLLKNKARMNTKTMVGYQSPYGYCPIHIACENGCYDVVKTLLQFGAEINQKDGDGRTPLDIANQKSKRKIETYLKRKGGEHSKKYLRNHSSNT
jgi:ankyrin repeat protein